jgi:ABC-type dipeptide/oligopeptide/nickel transport system permease component
MLAVAFGLRHDRSLDDPLHLQFADIPIMAAYLCLIALVFVTFGLAVNVPYFAFDPRLCADRGAAAQCERSR